MFSGTPGMPTAYFYWFISYSVVYIILCVISRIFDDIWGLVLTVLDRFKTQIYTQRLYEHLCRLLWSWNRASGWYIKNIIHQQVRIILCTSKCVWKLWIGVSVNHVSSLFWETSFNYLLFLVCRCTIWEIWRKKSPPSS